MLKTIIGLGQAGCSVSDEFSKISKNYSCHKIDVDIEKTKKNYSLIKYENPEDYEKYPPKLKTFFKNISGDVLFIVGGGGDVSNTTLVILEQLKDCKIHILYIKPDLSFLNTREKLQENMTYGVLQELTRSGVFERMYIVSNTAIEKSLGGIPVIGYYNKINEIIASTFHMINQLSELRPVVGTEVVPPIGARISTIGIVDLKNNEDKKFFSLDSVSDVAYFYAYNQKILESRKDLLEEIKSLSKIRNPEENKRVMFNIYATSYDESFVYLAEHTSIIQHN